MKIRVKQSCSAIPSVAGSKGFLYPDDNRCFTVSEGVTAEFLSYVSDRSESDLQAVAIKNSLVTGSDINDRLGVYWISRKNLEDID
jgi:hypothetical protein